MLARLAADEEWVRNVREGLDELGLYDVPVTDLMGTIDPETGRYVSVPHWTDPHFGVVEVDQRQRTPQEQAEYLHRMLADWTIGVGARELEDVAVIDEERPE